MSFSHAILLLLASTSTAAESSRQTAITARVVLKVVHPDDARKSILDFIKKKKGYPVLVTDHEVRIRVPPTAVTDVIRQASEEGHLIEKTIERKDLTEEIAQLEGRLRSKSEILKRLREFFDDSNVQATLQIEQNMTQLVTELEQVKGQLRVTRDKASLAVVDIAFRFRQRDRIVYVESPFKWLNSVDLDRFVSEF